MRKLRTQFVLRNIGWHAYYNEMDNARGKQETKNLWNRYDSLVKNFSDGLLTAQFQLVGDDDIFSKTIIHHPRQPRTNHLELIFSSQFWWKPSSIMIQIIACVPARWSGLILGLLHKKKSKKFSTHVNMEPASILLANVSNIWKRIECSEHRGTGCCRHKEWNLADILGRSNGSFQFAGNHAARLVRWDHDAIVCAQAADSRARFHRVMALVGRKHDQFAGQAFGSVLLVFREHAMACGQERVQIGNGTARCQDRITAIPANDFAHFAEHNVLHQKEDGRNFIGEHIGVGRCG